MSIIDGRQKRKWKIVELFATFFGWLVMLGLIVQIVLSLILWAFNGAYFYKEFILLGKIDDSIFIFSITTLTALIGFIVMYFWGKYNFSKYGHLDRRSFPKTVTSEDLANHFNLSISEVEKFRSDKRIVLERNIL